MSTTQKGVPAKKTPVAEGVEELAAEKSTPAQPAVNPRMAALDALTNKDFEGRDDGGASEEERKAYFDQLEEQAAHGAEDPPKEDATPAEEPVVSPESQAPAFQDADGNWMMKVKIDGTEQTVPISEVQTNYQKGAAADARLRQASDRAKELDRREQQLRATEQAMAQRAKQPTPSKPDAKVVSDAESNLAEAIYSGDQNMVTEAIGKFREVVTEQIQSAQATAPQTKELDPGQIAQLVENRIAVSSAQAQFAKDFAEVKADPFLEELADRESSRLLTEEPHLTPAENLQKAGEFAMKWLDSKRPAPKDTPDPAATRTERKRQTAGAPTGTVRSPSEAEPQVTHGSILDEMRRARGQAVA